MDDRVEMLNSVTGTIMLVPVELKDLYLAAGHTLAQQPGGERRKRRKANGHDIRDGG